MVKYAKVCITKILVGVLGTTHLQLVSLLKHLAEHACGN